MKGLVAHYNVEDMTLASVAPGEVVWVPYGFVPVLCGQADINACKAAPWINAALRNKLDEEVLDMISACTLAFAKKSGDKAPWKDMICELQSFFKP